MNKALFTKTIKQLRHDAGLKQQDVADLLRISRISLHNYETGKIIPGIDLIFRMSDLYLGDCISLIYIIAPKSTQNGLCKKSSVFQNAKTLSSEEITLINSYRDLDTQSKNAVMNLIRLLQ